MKRKVVTPNIEEFPDSLQQLLSGSTVYDSSSSQNARVWYIDQGDGYYLKSAPKGALKAEATMGEYFYRMGLSAEVLCFLQEDQDWLLTRRLPGEDCLDAQYLDDPRRLCDTTALLLRQLHELSPARCPINRRDVYIRTACENHRLGRYNASLFPDNWGYASAEDARKAMNDAIPYLSCDTLIHGDYCLPNIILTDWQLSGFIDLECAGLGDRHMDLHWGIWSLGFNLKTDKHRERFLDAYGRDVLNPWLLEAIGAFEVFL